MVHTRYVAGLALSNELTVQPPLHVVISVPVILLTMPPHLTSSEQSGTLHVKKFYIPRVACVHAQ